MLTVAALSVALVALTTLLHYEVLRGLNLSLPRLAMPARARLIVVIFGTFLAHSAEILLYALAIWLVTRHPGLGSLGGRARLTPWVALYFSAETFSSLGYGDVVPDGVLRLLAGVEALNGLLLIGWSASYTYLAMERFWNDNGRGP
jgi:hypothetical protein